DWASGAFKVDYRGRRLVCGALENSLSGTGHWIGTFVASLRPHRRTSSVPDEAWRHQQSERVRALNLIGTPHSSCTARKTLGSPKAFVVCSTLIQEVWPSEWKLRAAGEGGALTLTCAGSVRVRRCPTVRDRRRQQREGPGFALTRAP